MVDEIQQVQQEVKKIEKTFEIKRPEFWILIAFLAIVFYLELTVTIPSPIAFGDEAYHTQIAKLVAQNVDYYKWLPFEVDNIQTQAFPRTVMWEFLEGSFYFIMGFNPLIVKILVPLISLLTGLAAYALFSKVLNRLTGFISAVLTVTIPSVVTYANLFYVDTLLLFFATMFIGTFLLYEKTGGRRYLVLSTAFAALAILTKFSGYMIIFFYIIYFLYEFFKTKNLRVIKKYLFIVGLLALFLGGMYLRSIAFYHTLMCGLPIDFGKNLCSVNPNYTNQYQFSGVTAQVGTEQNVYSLGLISFFNFAYGQLWLVPLFFFIGIVYAAMHREKSNLILILFFIASLSVFYITYNGRAEDAARYTLIAIPAIAVFASNYLEKISEELKKYSKYLPALLVLTIMVVSFSNFYSKNVIMHGVKQFSPDFFQACDWVQQNLPLNATLLSLNTHPTVYNCNRNAIWGIQELPDVLLSNNVTLVKDRLNLDGIDYIFVQKFSISSTAYLQSYPISFIQLLDANNDTFQKVYENGPDLNTCLAQGGCDGTIIYKVL